MVVPFLAGTSQFRWIGVEWSLESPRLELRSISIERRLKGLQNLSLSVVTALIEPFPSLLDSLSLFPSLFRFICSPIHCLLTLSCSYLCRVCDPATLSVATQCSAKEENSNLHALKRTIPNAPTPQHSTFQPLSSPSVFLLNFPAIVQLESHKP